MTGAETGGHRSSGNVMTRTPVAVTGAELGCNRSSGNEKHAYPSHLHVAVILGGLPSEMSAFVRRGSGNSL